MVKAGTRVTRRLSRPMATACWTLVVVVAAVSAAFRGTSAQVSLPTGQNIAPAYEGWEQNPDGSFNLVFGYFNRNWEEAIDLAIKKLKPLAGSPGLAILASPLASNEDLMSSLAFAKDVLGASSVYVGGRPSGAEDHYLMTSDKNPNRKGLEWIASGLGLAVKSFQELQSAIAGGTVKALYAVGTEIPADPLAFAEQLKAIEWIVAQACNEGPMASHVDVVLPASTHLEDEGSFVNLDGIIQRFRSAYPPREQSQPHWKWAEALSRAAGTADVRTSARQVFRALCGRVEALASFPWDQAAPASRAGPGINPLPTAADGRPPGYREFGVPRVRGI